ncbi:DUF6705 family protein [Flavobacterium akiainvivens]|uniref:DUF6705 family protein n=1 Tax=Flavobacterium akiainvivens TaxID=1202724 RepID=UPI0008E334F1|nr:DUF6705 family protein [Flavobacterium akiainvivens]SFQ13018.1 hypothetical protein SAMN05444144_101212 [Flavobacterium akiainvivens]
MKWLVFLIVSTCYCQSPVLPLLDVADNDIAGAWYKDLDNEFGKFIGTWKFENTATNTSFTITLQKKEAFYISQFNHYEDLIIGEYKYVQNGVEIVNTLSNLNINHPDEYDYNIVLTSLVDIYTSTVGNRKKIILDFEDPERNYLDVSIIVTHIDAMIGTPAKIKVNWGGLLNYVREEDGPFTEVRVPQQEYILTKQP